MRAFALIALSIAAVYPAAAQTNAQKNKKAATPAVPPPPAVQKMDDAYTAKIRQYTTETFFSTEMVDHLPASDTVPSPDKVLGYVIGTPNKLTYTKDLYRYMRELEKATKRVRVFSIGKSEEGREMIIVAVSDEANIARLDRLKQITANLADPRKIDDKQAAALIEEGLPLYWASGSIHSPETGSPEMLMELAYRLAVEDSPRIQNIRKNEVVLITPVSEADGRDREVDVYNYRKENPAKQAPNLVYWGKYVAHDNNRDGMSMALALSRNMMGAFLDWHPTVLHDLHESQPFLYTSTGMGPYNAWLDPIVIDEWQKMAYEEIEQMTKRNVPGVWTHGYYDGWAPNYMFYIANGHNSIGRFYETFGGGGADTSQRTVPANATSRTWFRPNPPLPRVNWSIRDNINLQQSGLLIAMDYTANNRNTFLENFYLKSKRSVAKPTTEGPAAWVVPADDPRPVAAATLMDLLQIHGVEISKTTTESEVTEKGKKISIPNGSYVIRMDQPYSRMADMLLDTQFYNINDPPPYDDTGWTLGPLHNVKTVRVTDTGILKAPMLMVAVPAKATGQLTGAATAAAYLINNNTDNTLFTFRYRLKNAKMSAAEEAFSAGGQNFNAGTFVIKADAASRADVESNARDLGLKAVAVAEVPKVATHDIVAPRMVVVHTWTNTQNEGWYRIALDQLHIPYDYISDKELGKVADLRARWDVILFGPVGGTAQRIVNGIPMTGSPIPFKASAITPNLGGAPDTTDDMRGGMGVQGIANITKFVEQGGLFITITGNASIPIDYGMVEGVTIQGSGALRAQGTVVNAVFADRRSPIAYGYGENLAVYFNQSPLFNVAAGGGGRGGRGGGGGGGAEAPAAAGGGGRGGRGGGGGGGGRGGGAAAPAVAAANPGETGPNRPSGRGTPTDPDIPQGRPLFALPGPLTGPDVTAATDDFGGGGGGGRGGGANPAEAPRVVLRFANEADLFVSGMLSGGGELAGKPAVIDAPHGQGHVLMFANNPMWRSETHGSYFLLFNAMMNFAHLDAGRPAGRGGAPTGAAQ
jgi:Zinc carboxypeptidase